MTDRKIEYWAITSKENGAFVAAMENVLETYKKPYDAEYPTVCMDEQPVQLLDDVWEPIPETKKTPRRVDDECERRGTASILCLRNRLLASGYARERRTKLDWSEEVQGVLERYPNAKKLLLVCDNLNTRVYGSFYERFPTDEVFSICQRLEIRYTPKHGSWLNIAECVN